MLKNFIRTIVVPILLSVITGASSWGIRSCKSEKEVSTLHGKIIVQESIIKNCRDSIRYQADSIVSSAALISIKDEQIKGLQSLSLSLNNALKSSKVRVTECEERISKAIESGIILCQSDTVFIRKIPLSKYYEVIDKPEYLKIR